MKTKKILPPKEIITNTYSYTAILIALVISVAINAGLYFTYHSQNDLFEQREAVSNNEIQTWKEKAREEYAKHFIDSIKQEDGTILIPKGTVISCPSSDCTNFKIQLPENY